MTSFARALKGKLTGAVNYLEGKRVLDNASDPTSAYSKSLGGIGKPNPNDPRVKKQFTSTGKTYGVGVK